MADAEEAGELASFMDSRTCRALKGAAEVLGTIEEFRLLQNDPPDGMKER